ncbi:MAG: Ig-like domain-containing protein [Bryobacterales bacterium]|nr:Ig-like domain-containing protein [Bryobacterales bacterium]
MRSLRFVPLAALACVPLYAQDVGQGAAPGIAQKFVNAFYRNSFNTLVALPAAGNVKSFGGTGFVQEFNGAKSSAVFALVKANSSLALADDVYQMYPAMYSYFNSVGVNNAGFPAMDPGTCAVSADPPGPVCIFQLFTKNYALFAYPATLTAANSTANFTVRDPFYTRWTALGGVLGPGPAVSAEASVTGKTGATAVSQQYLAAALYNITSGAATGKVFAVTGKIYTLYAANGLDSGSLGLPLSEELLVSGGKTRQAFEGGSVELAPGADPVIRPAVGGVFLSIATSSVTRMNIGDTLRITANVFATTGGDLPDRDVTWVTSNGRVVTVTPNGHTATLRAVGGGTAVITAVSEGKLSPALTIFVAAPCCQIGEGAPTFAIQQAFQDTVNRFRLSIKLPAANPVRRAGLGYVQDLQSADGATRYLLCRSDRSPGVFLVTGDLLKAYDAQGGPAGPLGYPTSDATATGRQPFEGATLAGSPPQMVSGVILQRWDALGLETGALGPPAAAAVNYLSFTGSTGTGQLFRDGFLFQTRTGPLVSNRAILMRGLFLTRYLALNGPDGSAGFPLSDEYTSNGLLVQDCEGGQLRRRADGSDADFLSRERNPQVSVSPSRVTAGGRLRFIAGGFSPGASLHISFSQAGLTDFDVQTQNGSYTWESPVPVTAKTAAALVSARENGSGIQVAASYTITALADATLRISKVSGDTQTGLPGARLVNPIIVSLQDDQGVPLSGIPVRFAASPGASIVSSSSATDDTGMASASVRLQGSDGIALFTAEAAGKVVTFSARVAGSSLTGFPKQTRSGAAWSARENLLAAASSILRYHQTRNEMSSSLGLADPSTLSSYLQSFCVLDTSGGQICDGFLSFAPNLEQLPNLLRLKDFTGNNLDLEIVSSEDTAIRDLLAQGSPVLVTLVLSDAAGVFGSHFVVVTGIAGDGGILIQDPEPLWNRPRLADYTTGFTASGQQIAASVRSALRLVPRSPSPTGFLVTSYGASVSVTSQSGECGADLALPLTGTDGTRPSADAHLYYCAGLDRNQIVRLSAPKPYPALFTDLANPGAKSDLSRNGDAAFAATRPASQWQAGPVRISADPSAIVNAATFTPGLAPGALAAVFGTGLSSSASPASADVASADVAPADVASADVASADVDGVDAAVPLATEFRLNIVIPNETPPGGHQLHLRSAYGELQLPITVSELAPAIFVDSVTGRPAVFNAPGNQQNGPSSPAARGSAITIYATGLGASAARGSALQTVAPVTVVLLGEQYPASFAGPVSSLPGVYIVNLDIPAAAAPGLDQPLTLRQGGLDSNSIKVSLR